jgi:hypothetical protein
LKGRWGVEAIITKANKACGFSSIIFVPFFPLRNKPTAYSVIVTSLGHYVMVVLSQNPKKPYCA